MYYFKGRPPPPQPVAFVFHSRGRGRILNFKMFPQLVFKGRVATKERAAAAEQRLTTNWLEGYMTIWPSSCFNILIIWQSWMRWQQTTDNIMLKDAWCWKDYFLFWNTDRAFSLFHRRTATLLAEMCQQHFCVSQNLSWCHLFQNFTIFNLSSQNDNNNLDA